MKKLLIIPHHPENDGPRIRLVEIARALATRHEVFLVTWETARGEYTLANRLIANIRDLFKPPRARREGNLTVIEFPTLHRPVRVARWFNRRMLMRFVRELKIDTVVNGSYYLFTLPRHRSFRYIVDLADLPHAGYIDRYTREEARAADTVTVVSHGLGDYVRTSYRQDAAVIPNGTDIGKLRAVPASDVERLRESYGVRGKHVLGYIGMIGSWVNVDMAVKAFRLFQKSVPDSVLFWIGPAPDLGRLRETYAAQDIIFTGKVKEHIEACFMMLDTGILPHRKTPFQDMAFHLKLIEYSAAGKPVVSTPIQASMKLGFPNILFAEETEADWAAALLKAKDMVWQDGWDSYAENYDWKAICDKLEPLL